MLKTRFAPSPTGFLHLGNARTALFSALFARNRQGRFVLRIEDTDRERSRGEFTAALQEDLWWLGLPWDEGPAAGGEQGPYFQSERDGIYAHHYHQLEQAGLAYPCFCTPEELELSRAAQRAAGKAPRYSGKCARLSPAEVGERLARGLKPTLRFRVADEAVVAFTDLVQGEKLFRGSDMGDFIIRRADGSPAFFFCNAVDDALMGITHVLRGEDHLTNTPRQILMLQALGLPVPSYGHLSLIVGHDGAPLSKRNGSRSVRDLRAEGYLPAAVANYLARLGHSYESDALLSIDGLAAAFEVARLGRAPARYDAHQLLHWQHLAIAASSSAELWAWMGPAVHARVPQEHAEAFTEAVRPNVSFPSQALHWAEAVFAEPLILNDGAREAVATAGTSFFQAAVVALDVHGIDFKAFTEAVKTATGAKGKALFMPLRAALTGDMGGPEMARLLPLIGPERARRRLEACATKA
ncbi:MAG: glutamate--tRNA ligase [Thiohalomonadaceae bacterium]